MIPPVTFPQSRFLAGVSSGDVTPPVGIYHRMWGAATHDRSTGIHRPLQHTTLALAPRSSEDPEAEATIFIGLDHCLLWHQEMADLLQAISHASGVSPDRITVFFSHTHAAGLMGYERQQLPGGELILEYLSGLARTLAGAVTTAIAKIAPVAMVYGRGRCDLACHRDLYDPENNEYVCGFHPGGTADDTVIIGRMTSESTAETVLTLVNYACHPTTLAWENTLISPDYIGALRELIEQETGAPLLFIQGASGDVGPREGFVGDVAVADRHGRRLGYAVLSALEELPPPGMRFEYAGPVVSGATLGTWRNCPIDEKAQRDATLWTEREFSVDLPYRDDLPQKERLLEERADWQHREDAALADRDAAAARDARAMIERTTRRLTRVEHLSSGKYYQYRWKLWHTGDACWIALDGEHYNVLQRRLREEFPEQVLIIGTLANGSHVWYLPDAESYGKGLYQETASVLARGSLETLIDNISAVLRETLVP